MIYYFLGNLCFSALIYPNWNVSLLCVEISRIVLIFMIYGQNCNYQIEGYSSLKLENIEKMKMFFCEIMC